MGRFFDAKAALAEMRGNPIHTIRTIPEAEGTENCTNSTNCMPPNVENFEERAAIAEFDAGMTRAEAEDFAASAQGYDNVVEFRRAVRGDAA